MPETRLQIRFSIILITIISIILPVYASAQSPISSPTPTPIQIGINPNSDPNNEKTTLRYEVGPTKSVEDVVTIKNYSANAVYKLKLYCVDAIQSSDGASAFKLRDKNQRHVGQWITINQDRVELAPGETAYIPYRIDIPENSTPGTFQGGIVAELDTENTAAESNETVKIVSRFIEPIFISIPGRKKIEYKLEEFSYHNVDGKPQFIVKLKNSGNVFLKAEMDIEIEGTMLATPYNASLNQPSILQNETLESSFIFENPPAFGNYTAEISINVMEYDVMNDELRLLETLHQKITFSRIPYLQILIILIVIIVFIFGYKEIKKYRKKYSDDSNNTFEHKVKKGETIISIGKTYQVNWKKIARLNKLHSPYTISPGDIIVLPFPKAQNTGKKSTRSLDKNGK